MTVLQSVSRWLPQTATWLDTQVRMLPADINSHVVCEHKLNLDQFPYPRIHCLADRSPLEVAWDKGWRRLGARRHLGYYAEVARRVGASLVHSHFGNYGWRDSGFAHRTGLKHAVTFYGYDVSNLPETDARWYARYREMFRLVDRVLCEGEHMGSCIAALGCPEGKITVHHLGIDLKRIPYVPRTWAPGTPLRVLLSGSFREKKGFPIALNALARLNAETPVEITIIGDEHGSEATRKEKMRILDAIARGNLSDRTRLTGYQPWGVVMEESLAHHVFLSPSVHATDGDTEGGAPVSLIEMSASGMMIVSSTHCDIPGVILDGRTGYLAAERDEDGLVEMLRRVVHEPAAWRPMQDAGRRHIEAEFDARVQGERLGAIYHRMVSG